ncbi:hypothetical protein Anas_10947 [Armadillidium nasatum]|uniref:G-protein coupled receptors family 1 profile domain-containing protein n=1 Tax=Armadillidium nasatum TaxID=96803 RepID=A0A5N5TEW9_9CRUS|nr:hypothetical protein Anas_10947 [Armadillidium nasatum]
MNDDQNRVNLHCNKNIFIKTEGKNYSLQELSSTWILVARVWALFIAFLGIPGNILTASTIIYQVFINHRRQRLHSISDSCFQQLKIIKAGNVSESSEASSICSFNQRKKNTPIRKTTLCSHTRFSLKLPDKKKEGGRVRRSPTPGKNSLTSFTSRESSPGIPLTTKFTATVVEVSNTKRKESDQSNFDSHSRSPVKDLDEVYYDTKTENLNSDSCNGGTPSSPHNKHTELTYSVSNNNNIINEYVEHNPSVTEEDHDLEGRCPSTSSQTLKKQDFLLARKSLSIRSQSVSLHRNECSNYSSKPSFGRIGGDTILILHIILCDLFYCSVNLPHTYYVYGFENINGATPFLCKEAAFVRYVNAFAEWMTLGLLAIQRCIDLAKPPDARFFRMKSTLSFIVGIWVLSVILQLGNLINDNFGYNPVTKKCDCVVGHMTSLLYFYTLDSLLPCSLMMFGCFSIIFQIVRNKRRLQRFGMSVGDGCCERERDVAFGLPCSEPSSALPLLRHPHLYI